MSEVKKSELREAIWSLRGHLFLAGGVAVVAGLLSLAPIGYMRDVYGPVVDSRSSYTLAMATIILVGALALTGLIDWIRWKVLYAASVNFTQAISPRVFKAVFVANLRQNPPGSRQALGDIRVIRNFMSSAAMVALLDAPVAIIFLILVFFIHPTMGFLSLVGAITMLVLGLISERRVEPTIREAQRYSSAALGMITDATRNATVVQAMGMLPQLKKRWEGFQRSFLLNQAYASEAEAAGSALTKIVMLAQGSLLLAVGLWLSIVGILPPQAGAFLIIAKLLGARAVQPLMMVIKSRRQIEMVRDSFERLDEFLEKVPQRRPSMPLPPPVGHLTVEAAALKPPTARFPTISNVNLAVRPGECLAIVGPSGSGKTSLVRGLVGLWAPVAGSIRLDGVDMPAWDKAELGPYIGYLPQDVELFGGTVAENIARFGTPDPGHLSEVIALLGLQTLLEQLPDGVETQIGEGGASLSGGQRQRLAIARAMYGRPRLLVLDEPNSNLDEAGERDMLGAVAAAKQWGCAVVMVSHRRSVLSVVDLMLIVSAGHVRAFGPREKVLAAIAGAAAQQTATPPQPAVAPGSDLAQGAA